MIDTAHHHRRQRLAGAAAIAALGALLAAPAGATAADWRGTVLEADRSRDTIAIALPTGDVRTVRLPSKVVDRARVGERLSVRGARKLGDGTHRAKQVRTRGRSRTASLRGTVVAEDHRTRRTFVAADGTVVTLRTSSAVRRHLDVGDRIATRVRMRSHSTILRAASVRNAGTASATELEGIVLGLEGGVLRLAVARQGEVAIAVPDGLLAQAPAAGDQVEAVVSVGPDGALTLLALDVEDDDRDDDHGLEVEEEDGVAEVKAEGVLQSLAADALTVAVGSQALTCAVPAGADLSAFSVGEEVEARCVLGEGQPLLRKLESETAEFKVEDDGSFVVEREGDDEDDEDEGDDA